MMIKLVELYALGLARILASNNVTSEKDLDRALPILFPNLRDPVKEVYTGGSDRHFSWADPICPWIDGCYRNSEDRASPYYTIGNRNDQDVYHLAFAGDVMRSMTRILIRMYLAHPSSDSMEDIQLFLKKGKEGDTGILELIFSDNWVAASVTSDSDTGIGSRVLESRIRAITSTRVITYVVPS